MKHRALREKNIFSAMPKLRRLLVRQMVGRHACHIA